MDIYEQLVMDTRALSMRGGGTKLLLPMDLSELSTKLGACGRSINGYLKLNFFEHLQANMFDVFGADAKAIWRLFGTILSHLWLSLLWEVWGGRPCVDTPRAGVTTSTGVAKVSQDLSQNVALALDLFACLSFL